MTIFLDTSLVVAVFNADDDNHTRAVAIAGDLRERVHGQAYTSDFVLDEAVTLAWVRTKKRTLALRVGRFFFPPKGEPEAAILLHVDGGTVRRAWESWERHDAPLSFTDWTIVEQVRALGIDQVASFDSKLDPWVSRVH